MSSQRNECLEMRTTVVAQRSLCHTYSPLQKLLENFLTEVFWQWLFSLGFRVNKLVVNKVNFFLENCIKNQAFFFFC